MQMVKETNAQNSATGNGLKGTVSRGLKALFLFLGGKKTQPQIQLAERTDGFWVVDTSGYGARWTGPYQREQDAKGVRTRLLKKLG